MASNNIGFHQHQPNHHLGSEQSQQQQQQFLSDPVIDGEEDDDEEDVCCAKCQARPEDVLILTCDHNLCLECASNNLYEQQTMHQNTFQTVICEYCQSATVLDPESATELLELQHQINNGDQQDKQKEVQQQMSQNASGTVDFARRTAGSASLVPGQGVGAARSVQQHHMTRPNAKSQNRQQIQQQQNQSYRHIRDFCKDHPEEEVQYFCFDCQTAPICPECVIHGAHHGHQVKLLKKAYPVIVKDMEELAIQVNTKIDDLALQDSRFESRKREIGEQNHAAKQYMANSFEELRKRIDQKERELMKHCDTQAMEHVAEMDGSTRLIKGRMAHLGEAIDSINQQIQQEDEVSLASFYAQNYVSLKRTCLMDSDLPQIKEIPEKVSLQAKMDMSSLDQFLRDIESIQLCLESFQLNNGEQQQQQQQMQQRHQQMQSRPSQRRQQQSSVQTHQQSNNQQQHYDRMSTQNMDENSFNHGSSGQQMLPNDPSAKSVFQVAYSQKSEKQGPSANGHEQNNAGASLQVSVAQTMHQLQKQKQQQAQAFFSSGGGGGNRQHSQQHQMVPPRRPSNNGGLNRLAVGGADENHDEEGIGSDHENAF